MYSYEERKKAVELYMKYDRRGRTVIRELGHPSSRNTLKKWCQEFLETSRLHKNYRSYERYSQEEKEIAIRHYQEHRKCAISTFGRWSIPIVRRLPNGWMSSFRKEESIVCQRNSW